MCILLVLCKFKEIWHMIFFLVNYQEELRLVEHLYFKVITILVNFDCYSEKEAKNFVMAVKCIWGYCWVHSNSTLRYVRSAVLGNEIIASSSLIVYKKDIIL